MPFFGSAHGRSWSVDAAELHKIAMIVILCWRFGIVPPQGSVAPLTGLVACVCSISAIATTCPESRGRAIGGFPLSPVDGVQTCVSVWPFQRHVATCRPPAEVRSSRKHGYTQYKQYHHQNYCRRGHAERVAPFSQVSFRVHREVAWPHATNEIVPRNTKNTKFGSMQRCHSCDKGNN